MRPAAGHIDVRDAFLASADGFVTLVGQLTPAQLDERGTDAWSVRELVGHTSRAFTATETVLDTPVDESTRWLSGPAAYFRAALAVPGVHSGIEERGREAAAAMGDDVAASVRDAAARVVRRVAGTGDDRVVQHRAGRIRFADYLATRVTELVLHTLDLQLALGMPTTAPPNAARLVAGLMVELSDRADPLALAAVLAGRAWPGGCDVLA